MKPPARHWRSYGTDPLPTPQEAMLEPMRAFLQIECDRCGKTGMHNPVHMTERQRGIVLRVLAKARRFAPTMPRPARPFTVR